jgi:hypothetical protein
MLRVRAASAEFTPVDKKEPTPLLEAGSKRQRRVKLNLSQFCIAPTPVSDTRF